MTDSPAPLREVEVPAPRAPRPSPLVLSVVIPAYNEAAVIAGTVEAVTRYLRAAGVTHEVLIVDDGSTDRTAEIVEGLATTQPGIRVVRSDHRGKGGAVRHGVLAATGRYLLFMDADHSTRIETWEQFAPSLRDGYELVIGSRKMPGATITVRQTLLRRLMGKGFTWLTNVMLPVRVTDVTCGFKCFRTEVVQAIARLQRIEGWGFDAELLFLARRTGCRVKELPVVWRNDATTNVRLARDTLRSLTELLRIRLGAWRGWYGER